MIDPTGPVRDAELRIVAVTPSPCPCAPLDGLDNDTPQCACPAALAQWQRQLASCTWPPRVLATARTNERGWASLSVADPRHAIEASGPGGIRWTAVPEQRNRLAFELAAPVVPRLAITADHKPATGVRGAITFPDGHCVPLRRDGDAWIPVAPIARSEDAVVIVETPGYATAVRAWSPDSAFELELHRSAPVTGICEDGDEARLDNPFQHLTTRLDRDHRFRFTGVIAMASKITCRDRGEIVGRFRHTPGETLEDDDVTIYGGYGFFCNTVEVVDPDGRPIEDAEVEHWTPHGDNYGTGTSARTDIHGKACVPEFLGGELVAHPPANRGGQCAGEARLDVKPWEGTAPRIRMTLATRALDRENWRGRIVSPERAPVAGAVVSITDVAPAQTAECSDRSDTMITTELDGTFLLHALPRGKVTLSIHHAWYTDTEVEIVVGEPSRDLVVGRGATWHGRVLDPDGNVIEACTIFLTQPSGGIESAACSRTGFALATLVPGDAKVTVRVENHALGKFRTLARTVHITADEHHVEDLQWPRGEAISGTVVDPAGTPIAGARLTALPKGTAELSNRFHNTEVMLEADAAGAFTFRHLAPGAWIIRGDRRAAQQASHELATGSTHVTLVVPRK